jgi:glycosyltransferase involved in cell wall biosynthesis
MEILIVLLILLAFFHLIALSVTIYNYFTAPKIYNVIHDLVKTPLISVLVPARNEEKNIEECIDSVLMQHYNNYELIVLDDNSKDGTADIVKVYENKNSHIKLIAGKKLQSGWLGKNWACHQLSEHASGDVLVFLDADVRLEENALNAALYKMHKRNADVLSVFPTQIMKSWGEYFIVPLMNWLLLTFLPLKKVYTSENKSFVAANGQFIMFNRRVYDQIEGHKSVKDEVVEDMAFARLLKSAGFRLVTALGHTSIFCRMYDSFDDAYNGFVKNFFPGFRINPFLFWCFILLIQLVYMLPIVMSFIDINFLIVTFAIILNRLLISFTSNQNPLIGIIHPLQMFLLIMIGYSSVNSHRSGNVEWKGRKLT